MGYRRKLGFQIPEVSLIGVGFMFPRLSPPCWVGLVVTTGALAALDHEATLGMEGED